MSASGGLVTKALPCSTGVFWVDDVGLGSDGCAAKEAEAKGALQTLGTMGGVAGTLRFFFGDAADVDV